MGFKKILEVSTKIPHAVCPECLTAHSPTAPHNIDSIYYNCVFFGVHNRWPTWADAVLHCISRTDIYPAEFAVTRLG